MALVASSRRALGTISCYMTLLLAQGAGLFLARFLVALDLEDSSLVDSFNRHELLDDLQDRLFLVLGIRTHVDVSLNYIITGQEAQECIHGWRVV